MSLAGAGLIAPSLLARSIDQEVPQLDPKVVEEFVGAGHSNLDKVKELIAQYPTLLNAAHDWGGGDFETALGAASHVGNLEAAGWLVAQGAQTNIFTACVFGQIELVKITIQSFPAVLNAKGPHGFTLLHHAIRGGVNALEVKDYLESLGAVETKIALY